MTGMADKHPPGRPPVARGERSVGVHVRLSSSTFDRLDAIAKSERLGSVPNVIRRELARRAADDDDDDPDA